MRKEIVSGVLLAVLIFLLWQGFSLTPFLLLGGVGLMLYLLLEKKGMVRTANFENYVPGQQITFSDIGGQETAKQELQECLEFLVKAELVERMGIRPLKGILLTGPPGTGKTLMAKAAASYTESLFLATNGSEFVEVYAGVGAQRVRQLFRKAREQAAKQNKRSAIIFIDELEVLGGKRGSHAGHLEYDQTLNQLLVEMDGLRGDERVRLLVMAATNRLDMLDPALLRPGRFDRHVRVNLPDKAGRLSILRLHTRNKPLSEGVDLDALARETFGFSGAHLESLSNEAAIMALRETEDTIKQNHLMEAMEKVMLGEKLDRKPSPDELQRISLHESGHALISELLRPNSVAHVTITSRGSALGYVRQSPKDDMYLYTKAYLEEQIAICLAGSVAEEIMLGSRSTGATNDFRETMELAKQIVGSGLSKLGIVSLDSLPLDVLNRTVDEIIVQQDSVVRNLMQPRIQLLTQIAQRLLSEETVTGAWLQQLLQEAKCA